MSDYETLDDVELTEDHKDFLMEAGASSEFDHLLSYPEFMSNVDRHSLREEIESYIYYGELDLDSDPESFKPIGGHFFDAMWRGDLFAAWLRADNVNRCLMLDCFGPDWIIRTGVRSGEPKDYVETMVSEGQTAL